MFSAVYSRRRPAKIGVIGVIGVIVAATVGSAAIADSVGKAATGRIATA